MLAENNNRHRLSTLRKVKEIKRTKTDVLIIGGSVSGIVTAVTAKSNYPDAKITIIRKEIECPYKIVFKQSTMPVVMTNTGLNPPS